MEVGWSFADETIKCSLPCRIEVTGRVPVHAGRQSASDPGGSLRPSSRCSTGRVASRRLLMAALAAGVAHLARVGEAVGGLVQQGVQHVGGTARQAFLWRNPAERLSGWDAVRLLSWPLNRSGDSAHDEPLCHRSR